MKSQRIAVAGGTGKIGKHIVEGLLEIKQQHSLEVIVLSRSASPEGISYAGSNAPVVAVDYKSQDSIKVVLNEYQIDTIISTISGHTPDAFIHAQETLLQAGLSVPTVHRFAPSEFAVDSEQIPMKVNQKKLPILRSLKQAKHDRPGSFEYSRFSCGIFMNYLGYGNTKPEGYKAHGHLPIFPFFIDLSKRVAAVPGDGERRIVYTLAEDVGKFVAAASQLEVWEERYDMASEVMTFNQVIRACEEVCGEKLNVRYNTREQILAGMSSDPMKVVENLNLEAQVGILTKMYPTAAQQITEFWVDVVLELFLAYIDGSCEIEKPNLNELVDVKPTGVRAYLKEWWA